MTHWYHKQFSELLVDELHAILKLRQDVFIIEQQCIYPDIDEVDVLATHLFARAKVNGPICAYLRIIAPGIKFDEATIGRVLTHESERGTGLGRALMQQALKIMADQYPSQPIKISAQVYLEDFYKSLNFKTVSKPYDDDGIMHIDMLLS